MGWPFRTLLKLDWLFCLTFSAFVHFLVILRLPASLTCKCSYLNYQIEGLVLLIHSSQPETGS